MTSVVVRGFGYGITHTTRICVDQIIHAAWPSEKYPFTGILSPVTADCGNTVRSVQPLVVVMNEGTKVSCRYCQRATR